MEMSEKKKTPLSDLMDASLAKIREMVNSNTVVGQPITTPDGVTLIPVSRLSFGFGAGGSDYGKQPTPNFRGKTRRCSTTAANAALPRARA